MTHTASPGQGRGARLEDRGAHHHEGRGARHLEVGARGEGLAAEYLQGLGYRILARNWRAGRRGELDLVARDGDCIVAVEVKTRTGDGYGSPFESITALKVAKLRHLLAAWAHEHRPGATAIRIDAVAVMLVPGAEPAIEHLRGIQ